MILAPQKKFWGVNLLLACLGGGLFGWQYSLDQRLEESQHLVWALRQEITLHTKARQLESTKAPLLTQMSARAFVQESAPTYQALKEIVVRRAKSGHLEKVRLKGETPVVSQGLHQRPVTIFLQAPLDTDVYAFMEDLTHHLPGVMQWTFFSLFHTNDGFVQGELQGDFFTYEK